MVQKRFRTADLANNVSQIVNDEKQKTVTTTTTFHFGLKANICTDSRPDDAIR